MFTLIIFPLFLLSSIKSFKPLSLSLTFQDSGKVEVERLRVQGLVALEESCVCFLQRKSRG